MLSNLLESNFNPFFNFLVNLVKINEVHSDAAER
jgi:hypothetical protein